MLTWLKRLLVGSPRTTSVSPNRRLWITPFGTIEAPNERTAWSIGYNRFRDRERAMNGQPPAAGYCAMCFWPRPQHHPRCPERDPELN